MHWFRQENSEEQQQINPSVEVMPISASADNLSDQWIFRCELRNSQGIATRNFQVTIIGHPKLFADIPIPQLKEVFEGNSAVLECPLTAETVRAMDFDGSEIEWKHRERQIVIF